MSVLLRNVKKTFREPNGNMLPILNVSELKLDKGEQCVLIGPSGGGKTTLLNVIAGLTAPDAGEVVVDGTDIARFSELRRDRFRARKIGFVFQTFNLFKGFSALENVILGMSFSGEPVDRKRAEGLLAEVGLAGRMHHYPTTMSVGEQQRVAVARALANRPAVLLADEPTANVDMNNQQTILRLLRTGCEQNQVTLLMVTHDMEVAKQFPRLLRLTEFNRMGGAA